MHLQILEAVVTFQRGGGAPQRVEKVITKNKLASNLLVVLQANHVARSSMKGEYPTLAQVTPESQWIQTMQSELLAQSTWNWTCYLLEKKSLASKL